MGMEGWIMKKLRLLAAAVLCCAGIGAAAVTMQYAFADEDHMAARKLRESGKILSLENIAERARNHKAGEVLETELELKHGHYVYEVEILDAGGNVWELKLDAGTGDLITMKRDD
jgi:uncharacterized membrane protein YkoI